VGWGCGEYAAVETVGTAFWVVAFWGSGKMFSRRFLSPFFLGYDGVMVQAYHAIWGAYGFWLPNDPRGSWSAFVGSWEIFRYGKGVPAGTRFSRAAVAHDSEKRRGAKRALKYPAVVLDGVMARAAGRGFARAVEASGYGVLACAIMPDHVHVVMRRHAQDIERMVGHLKGRASRRMEEEGVHPLVRFRGRDGKVPTAWAEGCWKVFLNTEEEMERAVRYVEENPMKEGLGRQEWPFVERVGGNGG
jgi:REP element-mobilizing transposase RayT